MTYRLLLIALAHLAGACSSTNDGLLIELRAASFYSADSSGNRPTPNPADIPRSFVTDNGTEVSLTRGYVVIESVELIACPTPLAKSSFPNPLRTLARWLSPVSVAHAHTRAGPTRLGTPTVKNLLEADEQSVVLGTLGPPPATYCGADVILGPADIDAVGLPTDIDLMDTIYLEGTVTPPGQPSQPFSIADGTHRAITLTFPEDIGLGTAVDAMTVEIGLNYDVWLHGIDFLSNSAMEQGTRALDNAAGSTTVTLANSEPAS